MHVTTVVVSVLGSDATEPISVATIATNAIAVCLSVCCLCVSLELSCFITKAMIITKELKNVGCKSF